MHVDAAQFMPTVLAGKPELFKPKSKRRERRETIIPTYQEELHNNNLGVV